eukprot:SM002875S10735  [mRNA]  locus=s2875:83:1641:+ [translate_table: standard]
MVEPRRRPPAQPPLPLPLVLLLAAAVGHAGATDWVAIRDTLDPGGNILASTWIANNDPCNYNTPFRGVNCDGTGNVVDLELSGVGLNGSIPAQLNQLSLTRLETLTLSNNQLSGAIPAELGSLPADKLTVLDLQNNQITGQVPAGLAALGGNFRITPATGLCGAGFASIPSCTGDAVTPAAAP